MATFHENLVQSFNNFKEKYLMGTKVTDTSFTLIGTSEGSALAHTIYGMSVQDGTPTPTSPVEIKSAKANFKCVGKNLIPYPYSDGTSKTSNGITYTVNDDGSITANGTATDVSRFGVRVGNLNNVKSGERVTLSGCPSGGSNSKYGLYTQTINHFDFENGVTFDWAPNISGIAIVIYSGQTVNNLVFKPILTLAGTDKTFELYKYKDVITDLTLRAIEVASTDDYTYERNGKYYIADTIDWSEDEGYVITRRIGHTLLSSLTYVKEDSRFVSEVLPVNDKLYSESPTRLTTFLCSSYLNSNTANEGTCFIGKGAGNAKKLYIYASQYSTLSDFVASLTSADYIVYPLSAYSTEPITSEQAQALLSLKTYDEATNISATGDIEPSLDLEYSNTNVGAKALTGHNEGFKAQELVRDMNDDIDQINADLTDNNKSFKFGYDSENDQYGYYKEEAGADTFVPFKGEPTVIHCGDGNTLNGTSFDIKSKTDKYQDLVLGKNLFVHITGSGVYVLRADGTGSPSYNPSTGSLWVPRMTWYADGSGRTLYVAYSVYAVI